MQKLSFGGKYLKKVCPVGKLRLRNIITFSVPMARKFNSVPIVQKIEDTPFWSHLGSSLRGDWGHTLAASHTVFQSGRSLTRLFVAKCSPCVYTEVREFQRSDCGFVELAECATTQVEAIQPKNWLRWNGHPWEWNQLARSPQSPLRKESSWFRDIGFSLLVPLVWL